MDAGLASRPDPAASLAGHAPGVLASAATGIVGFIEKIRRRRRPHLRQCRHPARHGRLADAEAEAQRLLPALRGIGPRRPATSNFGLWFGNQFQPRDLGMWGYAAVSAPTLGSALENLVGLFRYPPGKLGDAAARAARTG